MHDLILNVEKKGDIYYPVNIQEKISIPNYDHDIFCDVEENSFWFLHRNKCIASLIQSFAPNDTLIDIGGGNGFTSYFLKKQGIKSIVVEPGQQGAYNASKRGIETVCGAIDELSFNKSNVKSIGLFDVIEHIEDDLGFLKKIYDISSEGVKVFVAVPAYQFLWSDWDNYVDHYRRYNLTRLSQVLKDAGFKVEYSSYYFQILTLPIFLLRALPYRIGYHQKIIKENIQKDNDYRNFFQRFIQAFLNNELKKIQLLKKLNYGASIILVATK
jgi:hypothetical protein